MSSVPDPESTLLRKPAQLRPGDTIGVVSPAGPLNDERLERLQSAIRYLENKGYNVVLGRYLRERHGYLAGSDDMRADDVNDMLRRDDVQAIFCTRGGYGLTRILEKIDYSAAMSQPKIMLGYSDVTALQMALLTQARMISFSGPMIAIELGADPAPMTEDSMWSMLTSDVSEISMDELSDDLAHIMSGGKAEGRLIGGCLSVLVSILGTPYMPDMNGTILLLEDIGEELYKIDRYLSQLKNAGILDAVKGVLLGRFVDIAADENDNPIQLQDVLNFYFGSLKVPVLVNIPYGHSSLNLTLPIGCPVQLDADNHKVRLLESCFAP